MTHKPALAVFFAGLTTLAVASTAWAQTSDTKIFVDVNVGAQTQARTLSTSTSFPLYGETAIINAAEAVDGGGLFDISGRYRVMPKVSAGVGFSIFSNSGDGTLAASIPNPDFLNRPASTSTTASHLNHREQAVHLMAAYTIPVTFMKKTVDATVFAGPSFFSLKQDILSANVTSGTQTAVVATTSETASKAGGNVGVNLSYMVKPNYGAGVFLRYAGATVKLPSAGDVKVGGFQLGIGARLAFDF
jgi:hypothetical protein